MLICMVYLIMMSMILIIRCKDHGTLSKRPNIALLVYCIIERVKIIYCSYIVKLIYQFLDKIICLKLHNVKVFHFNSTQLHI